MYIGAQAPKSDLRGKMSFEVRILIATIIRLAKRHVETGKADTVLKTDQAGQGKVKLQM